MLSVEVAFRKRNMQCVDDEPADMRRFATSVAHTSRKEPIMALTSKDDVRDQLLDDVYGSAEVSVAMPKYKMPEREHHPDHVYRVVHDELMLDGNSRQNLATFCQTWVDDNVHKIMD